MTVGEYLRKLREEKGISLEKVSEGTNIRMNYLQAIENDQLDRLPSLSQAKGFTRLYADYLGLSSRDVFDEVEKLNQPEKVVPENKEAVTDVPAPVLVEKAQPVKRKVKKRIFGAAESGESQEGKSIASEVEIPVSQVIFNEIGKDLKHQRESLGLSLADVERLTKIREFFVYALENGQIDDLPSTVQGRGMLNNYASFLNLNAESLQLRYAEGLQKRRQEKFQTEEKTRKSGVTVMGKEPLSSWRRFLTPDLLVGGTVFIILFALVIWGATQMIRTTNPEPVSTLSSISEILVGDGTQDTTLTGVAPGGVSPATTGTPSAMNTAQVDLEATLSSVGTGPIQVVVVAYQRAYMKITVDGEEAFVGRVVPGNVYSYTGSTKITLLTGNAAALQVYYNQQDQGVLGPMGNVVELEFTRQEMVTPTPRFSPTPTLTQRPTLTALPTNTPQPTPTAPTATITPARPPVP
jgi:cytoskeletal protein RodZ